MFFDLVRRNSRRSRKENGLFFASLLVSIVAFYIILSLENQDVMIFLKTVESQAVTKLLKLIPVLYGISLFIIFFLVYFASKYQLERRNHEFGIYLMMGMKRTRLFAILMAEDIWSSLLSLMVGIPAALLLSEIISLVTARLVGLGIVGHHFTFSAKAALLTVLGLFVVKFLALAALSSKVVRKEVTHLLEDTQEEKQKIARGQNSLLKLFVGIACLAIAYGLGIRGESWKSLARMGITVILGIGGTFFLFQGFSTWMEIRMKQRRVKKGLYVFTFRQLQENVLLCSGSLAISSLLVLMALCCFGYGVSVGSTFLESDSHVLDFTFTGEEDVIRRQLKSPELSGYIDEVFTVRTGILLAGDVFEDDSKREIHEFEPEQFLVEVRKLEDSREKEVLLNNLQYFNSPYLISLSGYNKILELQGKEPIQLSDHQMMLYHDIGFMNEKLKNALEAALRRKPMLLIDGEAYQLMESVYSDNLVVDRSITIHYGLIVTDDVFETLVDKTDFSFFYNAVLDKGIVKKEGLMQAIGQVNAILNETGLEYESYLQNIGRQLFYVVASSYTTIYLAIIFLIIANTVIGVQFLMQQRKTGKRYRTLISLGSDYASICKSARTQIKWYFGLPVIVAAVSSIFGIASLFTGILPSGLKSQEILLLAAAGAVIGVLCVIEYIYVAAVMKLSDKHILELMQQDRSG